MSTTRSGDRPSRSHVEPTPPAKPAPADDPAWAPTLMLAALAREARPTTTNEETTAMTDTPTRGLEWIADRLDHLNGEQVAIFEDIDDRAEAGEDIDSETDEVRRYAMGAAEAYGTAARMIRAALAPPTDRGDTPTFPTDGSMETAP